MLATPALPRPRSTARYKRALGLHLRTTESVIRLLDRFLVEQHVGTIEAITPDVIEAFLVSRPRTVPHSFNQLLGIVTRLFEWLIARDLVSRSPVQAKPRRTTVSRLPFLFDPATARRLIEAAGALHDTRNTPRRGLTYRTIFALLYALGLRVGEVARLRMTDIDLTRQILVVRETKFAKSRLVPFGPRVGELVADYLSRRAWRPASCIPRRRTPAAKRPPACLHQGASGCLAALSQLCRGRCAVSAHADYPRCAYTRPRPAVPSASRRQPPQSSANTQPSAHHAACVL